MSLTYLPKQLPSDHIVQRRFSPYKKANLLISHLERSKLRSNSTDLPHTPLSPLKQKNPPVQLSDTKPFVTSPMSKLSQEFQQKIEIINNFNKLSESKPFRVKKPKREIIPNPSSRKILVKLNKKNYHELINKAFHDMNGKSNKEVLVTEKMDLVSRNKSTPNSKSQEKIASTRASERPEGGKDFGSFDGGFNFEGSRCAQVRTKTHRRSRVFELSRESLCNRMELKKSRLSINIDLKDLICVSPILDLSKCTGMR